MAGATRDLGTGEYAANQIDTSSLLLDGTVTATTNAQALGADARCVEILVQAEPTNSDAVRVGSSSSQSTYIAAGERIVVPATSPALVYVKAVSGSQRVNWLARGA